MFAIHISFQKYCDSCDKSGAGSEVYSIRRLISAIPDLSMQTLNLASEAIIEWFNFIESRK